MSRSGAWRIAGAVLAMAALVAVVLFLRARAEEERASANAQTWRDRLVATPKGALRPDAVLSIVPSGSAASGTPASFRLAPGVREFYAATDLAPLYARLSKGPRAPEEHWVLARILEYCAMIPDEPPRGAANPARQGMPERRSRFAAALSPSDPDRDKRLAAFDLAMANRCEDLPKLKSTRAEIDNLYREGAAAGDAKARVALVLEDLRAQARDRSGLKGSGNSPALGDEQMAVLRQALASSDPTTAMQAVDALMRAFSNVSLRDPDGKPVDIGALHSAAELIACESGYPCGPESPDIARACAYIGQCDAVSLRDYLLYYRSSPHDSQALARYESALRDAARTGDTSFLVFYPAPAPAFAAFQ